eukprot:jgi/Ulvmu1/6225/UM028_0083.1
MLRQVYKLACLLPFAHLLFCWIAPSACAKALAPEFAVVDHRCADEHGPGSEAHEAAINRLDGKRIVFIGDVSVRYQYLELAYYLSHGRCPDPDDANYILDQDRFDDFNEFYRVSSQVLNIRRVDIRSREVCICTRLALEPGQVEEQRSYVYEDRKGRKVEMLFEQYFQEEYGRLETILYAAKGLWPTDILVSYGYWQRKTDLKCGDGDGDAKHCTGFQFVCGELTRKEKYKIWWLTVPPSSWQGIVVDVIPWQHHLHVGRRCYLPEQQVLDRGSLLRSMETEKDKLLGLWDGENTHKLRVDAYHAFNRQFLDRITPVGRNVTEPQWFDWLKPDDL